MLADRWRDGQVVDAYPALYEAALHAVLDTLFSTRADTGVVDRVHRSVETILDYLFRWMFLPPSLLRLPMAANRRFDRALADLDRSVATLIAQYRRTGRDQGDLLSTMLATQRHADGGLSDAEIADEVAREGRTGRVVCETLRLYPPGWLFTRATGAPVEPAGRTLPAGSTVLFMAPAAAEPDPAPRVR
ncbi:cytochrome P450 [Actinomadura kijaniata]|uniref:cytochrome P450 n=1 Tax=Actinomadura kijaniata TaxID=46161 RepID=UPI000831DA8D|nr:cytochrome P450 [Actinomadura kijaniata]